jgi:lipoprotein-anchoring transpeptidase ErfK/SrfK
MTTTPHAITSGPGRRGTSGRRQTVPVRRPNRLLKRIPIVVAALVVVAASAALGLPDGVDPAPLPASALAASTTTPDRAPVQPQAPRRAPNSDRASPSSAALPAAPPPAAVAPAIAPAESSDLPPASTIAPQETTAPVTTPMPAVETTLPAAATSSTSPPTSAPPPASVVPPVLIATTSGADLAVRAEPRADAELVALKPGVNEWDAVTSYPVVEEQLAADGAWYRVRLPHRPNGFTGWVPAVAVAIRPSDWRLRVSLSERTLVAERAGVAELTVPVAIGTDTNPTPLGTGFIRAVISAPNPQGAYGPIVFALGLHSDTLTEFAGGNGEVAIHGTNAPGKIGQAVSHGCIRLHNEDIVRLVELALPLGTPVDVVE